MVVECWVGGSVRSPGCLTCLSFPLRITAVRSQGQRTEAIGSISYVILIQHKVTFDLYWARTKLAEQCVEQALRVTTPHILPRRRDTISVWI